MASVTETNSRGAHGEHASCPASLPGGSAAMKILAVAHDGADVICLGCGGMAGTHT